MRLTDRLMEMSRGVDLDLRELARAALYIDQLEGRLAQLTATLARRDAEASKEPVDVAYYDNLLKPIKSLTDEQRLELAKEYAEKDTVWIESRDGMEA